MKLYGITVDQKLGEIVLSDCPAFISDNIIAHLALPDSPLFLADSIVFYDEVNDVCEGDIVLRGGREIGKAYYNGGWFLHGIRERDKKLSEAGHISVVKGERNYLSLKRINNLSCRKPIKLYALGTELEFGSLIMIKGNEVIISGQRSHALRNEIFLSTGLCDGDGNVLRFGGYYDGGVIVMGPNYTIAVKHYDNELEQLNLEEE